MEILHEELKNYFDDNQKKINYLLEVLKTTNEEDWHYSQTIKGDYYAKSIEYNNITIKHISQSVIGEILKIHIDHKMVYVDNLFLSREAIAILVVLKRAEERAKEYNDGVRTKTILNEISED